MTPLERARFPRAAVAVDASETAAKLRRAANELDGLAGAADAYEPGTLRRMVRAVVLGVLYEAIGLESEVPS